MRRKLLLASLTFAIALSGCGKKEEKSATVEKSQVGEKTAESQKPKCVPGYNFELVSVDGKKISLSDFKGKVVILQFFGEFCPTCIREIPYLNELYERYKGKVVVIGMNTDYEGAPPPRLKKFVESKGIKYPVVVVDGKTWMNYPGFFTGSDIIPQTFFLDKNGNVCYYGVGFAPGDEMKYKAAVERLLQG